MSERPSGLTPEAPVPANEAVPAVVEAPTTPGKESQPIVPPRSGLDTSRRYTGRFIVLYAVLGVVLAAAITGLIVLVIRPGHTNPPAWSSWKPSNSNVPAMTKQIADHHASRYRMSEGGGQLVAIIPSGPQITSGTSNIAIKAIAIRKAPQSNTGIRILGADKTRMYTLCGLGQNCSIQGGTPSAERGRLVRREALEVALYTFRFVPAVDSIVAFMPPPPGETTASVLFLEKGDVNDQLTQPLNKTLTLATPPLPDDDDLAEAATIDKLTLKNMFSYELQALQTGGAALILDPVA
jgi:hypothetical protein